MKPDTMVFAIAFGLTILLGGCTGTNISNLVEKMGRDNASWCVATTNIYGNFAVARSNPDQLDVSCDSKNGLVIKSQPATPQMTVPLTITPQINMGAPEMAPQRQPPQRFPNSPGQRVPTR